MKKYLLFTLTLISLTACSNDVKRSLGIKKEAPDEFTVISNPPLIAPPNFELEEPGTRTEEYSGQASPLSSVEQEILGHDVTHKNSGKVSQELDAEKKAKDEKGMISKLFDSISSDEDQVIDPDKEKERIVANQKSGKHINEGEVKTMNSKSTLEKIFD
jgi:hypothetical protein